MIPIPQIVTPNVSAPLPIVPADALSAQTVHRVQTALVCMDAMLRAGFLGTGEERERRPVEQMLYDEALEFLTTYIAGRAKPAKKREQPVPTIPTDEAAYKRWIAKLHASRAMREKYHKCLWKPLYDRWLGPMMRLEPDPEEAVNALAQYVETAMPHLAGEERECIVRVNRIAAGENPVDKLQFADLLGDQATALGRAVGLERDYLGRPGEMAKCKAQSLYSMGVLLFGFNAEPLGEAYAESKPEGDAEAPEERVDLDFATSDHNELSDPGMPWVRCISATRFLGDATFQDFSRGSWAAVEYAMTVTEANAAYPKFKGQFRKHAAGEPSGLTHGDPGDQGRDDGIVRFFCVYLRRPGVMLILCDEHGGPREILAVQEIELGIEGLPFLLLGYEWPENHPYPKPPLARGYGSAKAEDDHLLTVFAAGRKIKTAILVNETQEPDLAAQLRKGDDQGVYTVKGDGKTALTTTEVGALRSEHLQLADTARQNSERNLALSDFALGRPEAGDTTAKEIQSREAAIGARQQGLIRPARAFEASTYRNLIAIAYAKIDLLNGMMIPLGEGPNTQFAAFDASRPMIGELIDYAFTVEAADRFTSGDEVAQIQQALALLPNYEQFVAREGKGVRYAPLIETLLIKSRTPRAGEILYDLQPQPAAPGMQAGPPGAPPMQGGPPPEAGAPAGAEDPAALLEQLYAALQQLPEGDPREEEIMRAIAQIEAQMQTAAAPAPVAA